MPPVDSIIALLSWAKYRLIRRYYRSTPAPYLQGVRETMLCNKYKFFEFRRQPKNPRMIVYMTEGTEFTGIADRLRCMVSAYVMAKENGRDFYIFHNKDFELDKYLMPANEDWRIEEEEIRRGLNNVSFLWFLKSWPVLNPKCKEYHFYWGDLLARDLILPPAIQGKYTFSSAFWSLFKLTPCLEGMLNGAMHAAGLIENEYIAVHLRFLNFFEAVEERCEAINGTATKEEQQEMLNRVKKTLEVIYNQHGRKIVLFSDSNRFLNSEHAEYCTILPGQVGHVLRNSHNDNIIAKAFIDLFVISKARSVISITGDNIYGGGFSWTAAYIGGKPFIKVPLEM